MCGQPGVRMCVRLYVAQPCSTVLRIERPRTPRVFATCVGPHAGGTAFARRHRAGVAWYTTAVVAADIG